MSLEPLSAYGVTEHDIPRLVQNISPSSMQTNPIVLTHAEKEQLIRARLYKITTLRTTSLNCYYFIIMGNIDALGQHD